MTPHPRRTLATLIVALLVGFGSAFVPAAEQAAATKVLTVDDYTRWRSISGAEISGDGKWVTYVAAADQHADGRDEAGAAPAESRDQPGRRGRERDRRHVLGRLEVDRVSGGSRRRARARRAWRGGERRGGGAASRLRQAQGRPLRQARGRGRRRRPGARRERRRRRRVASNCAISRRARCRSWQDIQSFTFSPNSTHLVLRRRPPSAAGRGGPRRRDRRRRCTPGGGGGGGGARQQLRPTRRPDPRGVDVTVHNLVDRPRSAARQRRRHLVQQGGRAARLHRRRGGEGQQRPVRPRSRAAAA